MSNEIQERNIKLIERYVNSKMKTNTSTNYFSDLKSFSEFVNKDLLEIRIDDVNNYLKTIYPSFKHSSLNRFLASIKDFYSYYIDMEEYKNNNPTCRMKRYPVSNISETLPPTLDETKALIKLIKSKIKKAKDELTKVLEIRNLSLISLLINSGMRIDEALSLTFENLFLEEEYIKIFDHDTKGKKDRTIFLPTNTITYLKNYLDVRETLVKENEDKNIIFLSYRGRKLSENVTNKMLKNYGEEVGIEGLHNHILRHLYTTMVYDSCKDIVRTKDILGHSSIMITNRYINIKNLNDQKSIKLATANL